MTINKLGQYFTTDITLKEKIYEFILNNPTNILEPSIGQGDLIDYISNKNSKIIFDMYEIDNNIKTLDNVQKDKIIYCDFLKQVISKKYNTIIGNPPYVRTKKGNLYIDFIEKCYKLLNINGELIFIVPSDFLKLTSSSKLLNDMMSNGTFTHIFHPHDEKMFHNASIDIIIFRYCKNSCIDKTILYNNKLLYITHHNGLITFNDTKCDNKILFKDYFDIYVGFVSGKEEIFKNEELGNIRLLNGDSIYDKYILIKEFPCTDEKINKFLLKHKKTLIDRKIRKFNEKNWFEWGALRNFTTINKNIGKECIYIHNLTRKPTVSFLGTVGYFGGNLLILIPKCKCNLNNILKYLNSDIFKHNFIFSERFKIGHRQLSNSFIPNKYL